MDKETIKKFIQWLEAASNEEIDARRLEILDKQKRIYTAEGKADIRLALRLLDEEILARLQLSKTQRQ